MKILVLCQSRGYGGLELYVAQEVQQLQSRGHDCLPVVARGTMLDKQLREQSLQPAYLEVAVRRLPFLAARKLARLIDAQQIDLIHMHWNNDLNLAALARKFSRRKPKLVYSRHMAITRSKKDPLHRWFYREVDRLICVTRQMQKEAQRYLPLAAEQIRQLYLGVAEPADTAVQYADCFDENFPRRKFNVALFGRIEHYKGQHLLVAAVRKLIAEGLDVSATVIGHVMDQDYFAELQRQVKSENLDSYIKFEGFVSNPARRMKCYDAIVLTTYCETFGLVLIEAMHAGAVVIGTRCGGVPEIITDRETGLLFSPGDVDELADNIALLYRDPSLMLRCRENGKQKARQEFTESKHFESLEVLLKAAISS